LLTTGGNLQANDVKSRHDLRDPQDPQSELDAKIATDRQRSNGKAIGGMGESTALPYRPQAMPRATSWACRTAA
jgi:hypothetical protein